MGELVGQPRAAGGCGGDGGGGGCEGCVSWVVLLKEMKFLILDFCLK